jgi:hypothetical protein
MNKWKIVFKDGTECIIDTGTYTLGVAHDTQIGRAVLSTYDIFSCDYALVKYYTKYVENQAKT